MSCIDSKESQFPMSRLLRANPVKLLSWSAPAPPLARRDICTCLAGSSYKCGNVCEGYMLHVTCQTRYIHYTDLERKGEAALS